MDLRYAYAFPREPGRGDQAELKRVLATRT